MAVSMFSILCVMGRGVYGHYDLAYCNSRDGCVEDTAATGQHRTPTECLSHWMIDIPDFTALTEMSIPGTHNSISRYGGDAVANQSMDVAYQLQRGIRAFDIGVTHMFNKLHLYHGLVCQRGYLGKDVLAVFKNFLEETPSETIILQMQPEHTFLSDFKCTRNYTETYNAYRKAYKAIIAPWYWSYSLGGVRGKIVLLEDIQHSTRLTQNAWQLDGLTGLYDKWETVKASLQRAVRSPQDNTLYVHYLSAHGGWIGWPYFAASGHSNPRTGAPRLATGYTTPGWWWKWPDFPRVTCFWGICTIAYEGINVLTADFLDSHDGGGGRTGILFADFPGPRLINNIIRRNPFLDR